MTPLDFLGVAREVPYQPKGIFYSELYLFVSACSDHGVNLILESGVKHGISTQILARIYPGAVMSIDRSFEIAPPAGVQFIPGDACIALPELIARHPDHRIGVLIDGPKGERALRLKNVCLGYPNVRVVAIHDVARGSGETTHSHDWNFQTSAAARLDAWLEHEYADKYPNGPGLGIWHTKA